MGHSRSRAGNVGCRHSKRHVILLWYSETRILHLPLPSPPLPLLPSPPPLPRCIPPQLSRQLPYGELPLPRVSVGLALPAGVSLEFKLLSSETPPLIRVDLRQVLQQMLASFHQERKKVVISLPPTPISHGPSCPLPLTSKPSPPLLHVSTPACQPLSLSPTHSWHVSYPLPFPPRFTPALLPHKCPTPSHFPPAPLLLNLTLPHPPSRVSNPPALPQLPSSYPSLKPAPPLYPSLPLTHLCVPFLPPPRLSFLSPHHSRLRQRLRKARHSN